MIARAWGRKTKLGLLAVAFAMAFAFAPSDDTMLAAVDTPGVKAGASAGIDAGR